MTSVLSAERAYVAAAATLIELAAAIVVAAHAGWALVLIARARWVVETAALPARRVLTDGVLAALSFSMAATLLKTIALASWGQIRMFAFVLVFRTLLKQVFRWEEQTAERRRGERDAARVSGSAILARLQDGLSSTR